MMARRDKIAKQFTDKHGTKAYLICEQAFANL